MLGQVLRRNFQECSRLVIKSVRFQHHQATCLSTVRRPLEPPAAGILQVKWPTHPLILGESIKSVVPKQYILPPCSLQQISILDPKLHINSYRLPPVVHVAPDRLTPPWRTIVPVVVPGKPGQTEQLLMPVMVRIRHRKMKRHKYRKMRKRLVFLYRKQREVKRKKKLKIMTLYKAKWQKMADEFDAEAFAMDNIAKAKEHNWSIDVVKNWKKSKSGMQQKAPI